MELNKILLRLKKLGTKERRNGMARYGINTPKAFGVSIPELRSLAREIGKNRKLAFELWDSGFHEARILASMVDEHEKVTKRQMESWVKDFNSWDLCDQVIANLFEKSRFAIEMAYRWANRKEEFVKRAGFVIMARLAVSDKAAPDPFFEKMFPAIKKGAEDERGMVKKGVNWAIRQIGKRNHQLNGKALKLSKEILNQGGKAARWIANNAIRELESAPVKRRLAR